MIVYFSTRPKFGGKILLQKKKKNEFFYVDFRLNEKLVFSEFQFLKVVEQLK